MGSHSVIFHRTQVNTHAALITARQAGTQTQKKCCHLVKALAASTRRICSSVRQFLMHGTSVGMEG